MNEPSRLDLVRDGEEVKKWNQVAAEIDTAKRRSSRREALKSFALVAAVPLVASGWIARELKPRTQQHVEFIPIENGVPVQAYKIADMSPNAQGDMAVVTAWHYVMMRERFSSGTADSDYRMVSLMSDERVRREFQARNTPTNTASPWARFADKRIVVSIEKDSDVDLPLPTGYSGQPPGYGFRYWRTETSQIGRTSHDMWFASVRFYRDVKEVPPRHRREFNGPGIIVWEYPEPQKIS